MKLGKNAKNRLKIKEKAEILAQENFQKKKKKKRKSAEKRNSQTPDSYFFCFLMSFGAFFLHKMETEYF